MKAYRVTWSSIIAIILSLMMMNSCVKDLDEQWIDDPSSLMIQLNLRSGAPTEGTTSAEDPTTEPGKSYDYTKLGFDNENKLDHIAVLFYETNGDKELKWIAKPQEIKLIDSDKQLYSIKIPEVYRSYFQNKTYHIVVVANADDGDLPRLEDHSKLEDLPKKIIKKNIYVIKTKGQTKVNKPDSFVMTGEITNKTINIDERTGRYLGIVELYRLASKITCSVKVKQTTTFHMYLDETKPIEARFDNGVYNSALALPTDQTSLPDPLIRTFDKAGEPATKIQKREYLPISYQNDQDQTIKQAFYSYLWKEGDAPKLIIKVYLKESEDATQSTAYYYELPIAKPTNDETGNRWKIMRNTWYDVNLEISTKGQLSDKDPIHINGTYIVSEWTKDQKYYNYRLYGYRYLYVPQKEIVMVNPYNPSCEGFDRKTKAKDDMRTIAFDQI